MQNSFPLDCACGFGREVIENSVDALDLGRDSCNDLMKNGVGNLLDGGGHCVLGIYGADDCGPAFVAGVVLYADTLDVGNCDEVLPGLLCEAALVELVAENCISLAKSLESVAGDRAKATNAETGTGEGLTVNHSVGKSESFADYANLVLVEKLYGLAELELEILGKTANVVVGLNRLLALCLLYGFENVGVDSTLCKIFNALELSCLLLKYADKLAADIFLFSSGELTPASFSRYLSVASM